MPRRRNALMTAVLALTVVSASCARRSGWSEDQNPKWPGAIYHFAAKPDKAVYLRCHNVPVLSFTGGDYDTSLSSFQVLIDGEARSFPMTGGQKHGSILVVEDAPAVDSLTRAKRIEFRVGGWRRDLPGSPLIGRVVQECANLRR